jgi:catechol 2,3-dioxygenase-like lactoylglutathione lyase family enzyme
MSTKPIPQPNCPDTCRVFNHIPMASVADVDRSIEFYTLLGFACDSRFSGPDGVTNFTSLSSGRAYLMLTRASEPVVPSQQAVLFYMYSPDVAALRAHLLKQGLKDAGPPPGESEPAQRPEPLPERNAVFQPIFPFYMPEGEIRIHDPDGYCILVGQAGR